ncbi:methyl-accepting chemotaxis protein [Gynuella sunshinyii]|uniref:Methyl-accepting chemotaxis protein n=1 Tax=Gynuella sunshinyii YC6258 TaxID=1445510 RepID=A0A0C5VGX3_9GAMM|nr:methyl-accepting chemotaxis protein [Gynuella sunshinyii]AJQ93476.1 methyl-accepting chemotaxis protein [Gynuella sunshinyii YC6258]
MRQKSGNYLSVIGINRLYAILFVLLVLVIAVTVVVFIRLSTYNRYDSEYLQHVGELRVLSQQIAKDASEAASGQAEAFRSLQESRTKFQARWDYIVNGNEQTSLPGADASYHNLQSLQEVWDRAKLNADQIIASQSTILALHEVASTMSEKIPELQVEYDEVVETMLDIGSASSQIAVAQRQSWLAERIIRSVNKVLSGGEGAVMAADSFGRDATLFGRVLTGMLEGNSSLGITKVVDKNAVAALQDIKTKFEFVNGSVDQILETSPELFQVREAASSISNDSSALLKLATSLSDSFVNYSSQRFLKDYMVWPLGGIAILLIASIAGLFIRDTQLDLKDTAETNEQNQNAILRLLDELADLADGDLTTEATVTEDFTGAIADSINFAIDQMRGLVSAINATAVQVSSAAQETQATAMHLAEASEHQAQEIAGASAAVNEMAVSIDQVSANAAESSAVAERSVAIAKKGADVVQATINGMDNIREQIQETAKRIKRLGESSQEIGDIVSLINDIADQTNILALNAAIQASMAGDAGRGFAVVADEVQRLAERSSAATKQIEALVKTIQTDTNEAVISMEQTTSEVVRGARLAQDAGVALEEIENVSKSLADLIQNISNAARQQASSAGHISNTMNVIQEITSQTSAGTMATAKSIGNLAQLANEMRASVAGFKLPDSRSGQDSMSDDFDADLLSI